MLSHHERVCYHIVKEYVITSSESMLSHRQRVYYHIVRVCYHIVRDYDITCPELLMFPRCSGLEIFTIRGTTAVGKGPTKWGPG